MKAILVRQEPATYSITEDCPLDEPWLFECTHEETKVETAVQDHMGFQGHYQTEHQVVVCANPDCDETIGNYEPEEPDYE